MGAASCPLKNHCRRIDCDKLAEEHPIIVFCGASFVGLSLIALLIVWVPYLDSLRQATPNFKVWSLSVSLPNIGNISSNATSPLLVANWNVSLYIHNSYGFNDYLYERVEPRVFYKNVSLARTWVRPFVLDNYDTQDILLNLTAIPLNRSLADDIVSDWESGEVEFNVVVKATAKVKRMYGGRSKKKREVASCENVKVAFLPNNTQGIMVEQAEHTECPVWD